VLSALREGIGHRLPQRAWRPIATTPGLEVRESLGVSDAD